MIRDKRAFAGLQASAAAAAVTRGHPQLAYSSSFSARPFDNRGKLFETVVATVPVDPSVAAAVAVGGTTNTSNTSKPVSNIAALSTATTNTVTATTNA